MTTDFFHDFNGHSLNKRESQPVSWQKRPLNGRSFMQRTINFICCFFSVAKWKKWENRRTGHLDALRTESVVNKMFRERKLKAMRTSHQVGNHRNLSEMDPIKFRVKNVNSTRNSAIYWRKSRHPFLENWQNLSGT